MIRILGISAFYHDSAACLIEDGRLIAAAQEERFTRKKHDSSFPANAVRSCLKIAQSSLADVDYVIFYEKPFNKFERLLETYLRRSPKGIRSYLKAMPLWLKEKLWIKDQIRRKLEFEGPILFADHHESHAASAFYPSPFSSAAILTLDAVGEWATTSLARGDGNRVQLDQEIQFPDSLGLLYSTFTYYLGFRVNSGEYKVMGLAPYGRPLYTRLIRDKLIQTGADGSFSLNTEYFDYEVGLRMASSKFEKLFGGPPRGRNEPLTQRHKDLASSIQKVTEEVVLTIARHLSQKTAEPYLCMAGGVALNCVANGKILRETDFEKLWVQPAAGDAGGALGAAYLAWHRYLDKDRFLDDDARDAMGGALLGPEYSDGEINRFLQQEAAVYEELGEEALFNETARLLERGSVVGWYQGRMEFGPRALGNRSILADPRRAYMTDEINRRIKFRESFRPFAPAVLEEDVGSFFELREASPYMSLVAPVLEQCRRVIPAVTHVDGSARLQTVGQDVNPPFYRLLKAFRRLSGCPVLLNTSFNGRGEPIVESPQQAYQCFMRAGIDVLVMNRFLLKKENQPTGL